MQKHRKLKARILSLALSVAMVATMMPTTVFAVEGDGVAPGVSSVGEIQSFDKLEDRFIPNIGEGASPHIYGLTVELDTPYTDLQLPSELTAMVARTTTVSTPSDADEDIVVDSGKVDEPTKDEDIPSEDEIIPDEDEAVDEDADTDDTVSGNQPASPSDAQEKEEIKDDEVPLAPQPEQDKETITTTSKSEAIPVEWNSDKEYTSKKKGGPFIFTAEISEDYILADGVKLPQIYVYVGNQTRAGQITSAIDLTQAADDESGDGWSWNNTDKTLTLDGIDLLTSAESAVKLPDGATVVMTGTNTVESSYSGDSIAYGINGAGALIFKGTGTLTVTTSGTSADDNYGVYAGGAITVEGGTLIVTGGQGYTSYGIYADSDLTITGGTLTGASGTATDSDSNGIFAGNSIAVTNGTLTGTSGTTSGYSFGVLSSEIVVTSGTLIGTGGQGSSSYGISASSLSIAQAGKVTATGGIATDDSYGYSYGVSSNTITVTSGTLVAKCDTGTTAQAVSKAPTAEGATFTASTDAIGTPTTDYAAANIASYKYLKVENSATPPAAPLTGTVTVTGTLKFNQQLTATYSAGNNTGNLSYQWKRAGTNISGATSSTYTTVADDIGKTLSCEVKSTVQTGSVSGTASAVIAKADGPAAPSVTFSFDGNNANKLMGATTAMEYSLNGSTYSDCTADMDLTALLSGITAANDIKIRVKETTNNNVGAVQTIDITAGAAVTGVTATGCTTSSNNDGKLKGVTAAMEYKLSTANTWTAGTGSDITGLANGTYNVRNKATGTTLAGAASDFTVAAYSATPTYSVSLSTSGTHTFTSQTAGYGDQSPLTVTVSNTGNQSTGALTVALSGTNSGSFTLSKTSINSLAASGTDTFTVKPNTALTAGTYTATVTVSGGNSISASFNVSFTVNAGTPTVTDVTVSPATANVQKGGTQTFTATVTGTNSPAQTVTWAVSGGISGTSINNSGVLTVAAGETASTLTVTATSTVDTSKFGTAAVTVTEVPTTYTVTLNDGGSGASGAASYANGTSVSINAGTKSGYTFKNWTSGDVTFANANSASTTFTMPAKAVTVTANWTQNSSGGSTGGGGGGGGSSSTTTPTKPSAPVEGSSNAPATVDKNGNASTTVTDKNITDAIANAKTEANKKGVNASEITAVINVPTDGKDANTVTVNLPKTTQQQVINNKVDHVALVIEKPDINISMNLATITEINKQANADVQISATRMDNSKLTGEAKTAIGNRPTFDLKATYSSDSKSISNFGTGSVSVAIPYTLQAGEVAGGLYAVYVDGNGKVNYITNSSYDANAKMLRFATNHFSVYGIAYKAPMPFTDISGHWAKTDIEFVYNRGLMSGTSNTTFSPNGSMTRGMFVTALGRLSGVDVNSYKTSQFTDVAADAYYTPYVNWAASKGIIKGTSETTFAPDQNVTRQEMAVIMNRYAEVMGYKVPETREAITFADNASIGTWAAAAVKQMQMAGILNGKDGNRFDPTASATRGEVAAVLHRYISLVIDRVTAQGLDTNDSGSAIMYENGKAVKSASRTVSGTTYNFNANGEATAAPSAPEALPADNKKYIIYTVKKDDWLSKIAIAHNCTVNEILALNNISNKDLIYQGQQIKVPQK